MFTITRPLSRSWIALSGLLGSTALSLSAWAAQNIIQDRRIDLREAEAMVAEARLATDFPIVINDDVVTQLNRFVATPDGRQFIAEGLERMKELMPVLQPVFDARKAPREILAVGLVESGFRNLPPAANPVRAAGIWQFIAGTARAFGLRVDHVLDERLDVEKETDAALRFLQGSELRFQDWQLALLAYNAGPEAVQETIDRSGSRDPWVLLKNGLRTDKDYLARVMAAVLILKNPSLVE